MRIFFNGKIFESSHPIMVNELLKDDIKDNHIACIVNNQVHALDYEIREDSNVELLDTSCKQGREVYIRGIMYVMGKAFYDVYPE